jgi:hypothetical protein
VRVSSWRSRIDPILAAEEDRSAFDIHDYGSKILTRLQDTKQQPEDAAAAAAAAEEAAAQQAAEQLQQQQNDAAGGEPEIVDFKQVAGASDSFEVCRLFAAMLQLVNNRCGAGAEGWGRACAQGMHMQHGLASIWGGQRGVAVNQPVQSTLAKRGFLNCMPTSCDGWQHLPVLLSCRNINLIKQADPIQDGPSSIGDGGSTCSSLQLQLLTVARVHEAMAEGLAGGAQELGEAAAGTHAQQYCITCLWSGSMTCFLSAN